MLKEVLTGIESLRTKSPGLFKSKYLNDTTNQQLADFWTNVALAESDLIGPNYWHNLSYKPTGTPSIDAEATLKAFLNYIKPNKANIQAFGTDAPKRIIDMQKHGGGSKIDLSTKTGQAHAWKAIWNTYAKNALGSVPYFVNKGKTIEAAR